MQNNQTRWVAHWIDCYGVDNEYVFYSSPSRVVALIDFKLWFTQQYKRMPERFELEEGTTVLPTLPTRLMTGMLP
jgi:hypothetical protein